MSREVTLGGCAVHLCTEPQVLDHVEEALRIDAPGPLAIASANLDHLHHFGSGRPLEGRLLPREDSALRWMTLLDGYPLVRRVNHITGERWPRLTGADLIHPILSLAEKRNYHVGFLGGTAENHKRLQSTLAATYPRLEVAGYWAPARAEIQDPVSSAALARKVREAGVDILFVALGKPRQEQWIGSFGPLSGAKVLLAFGAATDFLTGQSKRAPRWVQDSGLEWAHRLTREPTRLGKRYLLEGPGAARLLLDKRNTETETHALRKTARRPIQSVGCLIVTYNNQEHIRAMLESIPGAAPGLDVRVVIVDNGSQDDTLSILKGFPDVTVVPSGGNLGYAGGINIGLNHLFPVDAIAILNPDLRLARGSLRKLADDLRDWHVGVTVPLIRNSVGARFDSLRREPTLLGAAGEALFGAHFPGRPLRLSDTLRRPQHYSQARDVDWASGAAWLISTDCLKAVGEWNEDYFLYSEETEYARRIRRAGYRIRFVPSAEVIHAEGGSGRSSRLATLLAVNRIRDYGSCHDSGRAQIFRLIVVLHHLLRLRQGNHREILRYLLMPRPLALPRATRDNV